MGKFEMIKWLQNLKEDIGQSQHQDLWHYAEMLDEVIGTIEVSEDNEPTWEQVKEYCFKRNFAIVGREMPKEYLRGLAEVSEDAISREQVLNLYKEWQPRLATNVYEFGLELEKLPSVIPTQNNAIQHVESVEKPKEGEWIEDNLGTVICSECQRPRRDSRIYHTKFCNSCGAKMKGKEKIKE